MRIITDEELAVAERDLERGGYYGCDTCPNDLPTKEDLIKDLIEARKQIKVLESNTCCC